ncbi:hypothetical protein G9A89_013195 [Geosiphon pyriformis]|nr:hypothetical protein G9A89_013195 [Geosiphon pyriformis]
MCKQPSDGLPPWNFYFSFCIVVILVLFFLFYSNRVIGQVLSRLISIYTWRKYHSLIEIESLQFAPLAGRVLFKNLKYRSRNQSFSILKGHITCRYWLWNVRQESQTNQDNRDTEKQLPCRIVCKVDGFEWFIYNRTPAYDALLSSIDKRTMQTSDIENSSGIIQSNREDFTVELNESEINDASESKNSFFRRILPIQLDCDHGAIIAGNSNVPSILVVEFGRANGIYSAVKISFLSPLFCSFLKINYLDLKHTYRTDGLHAKQFLEASSEYAKMPLILDCKELVMDYYSDYAGKVPPRSLPIDSTEDIEIGNGDRSPEWGINLLIAGGTINYGPWADRQRVHLQNFFFPPLYRSVEKTKLLDIGENRLHTTLKILIQLESDTVLRVPIREISKDWNYTDNNQNEEIQVSSANKTHGWLELNVGLFSTVNLILPMILTEDGYCNKLEMCFDQIELQTSVNYSKLLTANSCKIKCHLQNPLIWNESRQWLFNIDLDGAEIFLLRDHITLLQDLAKDWASSPSADLLHFIPMEYLINIRLKGIELYLYVNEHNIINNPSDIDDNAFFIIKSKQLMANIVIPFLNYEQEITKIPFTVEISPGAVLMSPQISQALAAFLSNESKEFLAVANFIIEGTYQYYSFIHPNHIESLSMKMIGKNVNLKAFGFVVRYFLMLQENYAGTFINFMTLEEYRSRHEERITSDQLKLASKPPADPFEVYLQLIIEEGSLSLPENLYTCDNASTIQFHELQLDLRNMDAYMDMDLTVSPLTWTLNSDSNPRKGSRSKPSKNAHNYVFLNELNIYAHRLFGPLPITATYVCNWDINIGAISGQLKPSFLLSIASFGKSFGYHFIDKENAFPAKYVVPLDPDVTFLNIGVQEIDVSVWGRDSGSQILLKEGLKVQFDDFANEKFTQKIVLKIPDLVIKSLAFSISKNSTMECKKEAEDYPWVEVANFEFAFDITIFRTTAGWRKRLQDQQTFLKEQDRETLRVPFLYGGANYSPEGSSVGSNSHHLGTLYVPPMPSPLPVGDSDANPLGYNESRNSSVTDICITENRKNTLMLGRRYDFLRHGDDSDDEQDGESWLRPEDESISDMNGSGISISNLSFHTATDGNLNQSDIESDDSEDSDNSEINFDDSESDDLEDYNSETNPQAPFPSAPRSIPYGSYLKRYRMTSERPFATTFTSSYLRPSPVLFTPAMDTELLSVDEENSQSFKSFPFPKTKTSSEDSFDDIFPEDEIMSPASPYEDAETTTIVFESTKSFKILLTPIFLKIIQEILEAIKGEHWNLEAMLDHIQIDYVGDITRLFPFKYTTTRFAISIPFVHFHLIQDVLLPDDLTNLTDEHPSIRTRYDLTDTILCTADFVLEQSTLRGMLKYEDTNFEVKDKTKNVEPKLKLLESKICLDIESLKLNVRLVDSIGFFGIEAMHRFNFSPPITNSSANAPVVLDVSLDRFKIKWIGSMQPNFFSLDINTFSASFITQSMEILTGAIYSWLFFTDDLSSIISSFITRRSRQLQKLVSEIAWYSKVTSIESDPTYLTRPSHVLRLGATNFQNDDGWKILGRIRHCKRLMDQEKLDQLQILLTTHDLSSLNPSQMFDTSLRVFSKWRRWEIENLSKSRLFTKLFEQHEDAAKRSADLINEAQVFLTSSANLGRLQINTVIFSVIEEQRENSVDIGTLRVDIESNYHKDSIPPLDLQNSFIEVNRGSEKDTTHSKPSIPVGYLDVIFRFYLKQLGVDVNPDMLALAKHWLKVHRVFTSKFESVSRTKEVYKKETESASVGHKSTSTINTLQDVRSQDPKDKNSKVIPIFNMKELLSRIEIVAHCITFLETMTVSASAQRISAKAQLSKVNISTLFYNPIANDIAEKPELENVSLNRSSLHPGSKGSGHTSNRIIISAIGGIENISMSIKEKTYSSPTGLNTLISVEFSRISTNTTFTRQCTSRKKQKKELEHEVLHFFVTLEAISVRAPQSLLKLYTFVEEWREENLPSYDFLFKGLMDEWEEQRKTNAQPSHHNSRTEQIIPYSSRIEMRFQFLMKRFYFQSNLLPSLRFHYEAWDLLIVLQQNSTALDGIHMDYSGQLVKQEIRFVTKQKQKNRPFSDNTAEESIELEQQAAFTIPAIRTTGNIRPFEQKKFTLIKKLLPGLSTRKYSKLDALIYLDFIKLQLNVNIIDHLFTAQSLLGNELNDVLDVFVFSSKKFKEREDASKNSALINIDLANAKTEKTLHNFLYSIKISLGGLKISALSPTAVGFFETKILNGHITNLPSVSSEKSDNFAWNFSAQNLSLSLNHNTGVTASEDDVRKYRIAYILIDLSLQNIKQKNDTVNNINKSNETFTTQSEESEFVESYSLKLFKVHAVMQPIALGRLMDLYVYYSGELERRKELKASHINKLADNTRKILQDLGVQIPKYKTKSRSLLDEKLLSLEIQKFTIALPLDLGEDDISTAKRTEGAHIPAFLFSASSMDFITRKWKTSCASLNELSLQFVPQFDQSNENHFSSQYHPKMNRIYFPEISCEVQTLGTKEKKQIFIDSRVEGFELDIGGNIVTHINTLGEIYAASRERLESFTAEANSTSISNTKGKGSSTTSLPSPSFKHENSQPNMLDLEIQATFTAKGGVWKLYPKHHFTRQQSIRTQKISEKSRSSRGSLASLPRLNLDTLYSYTSPEEPSRQGENGIDVIVIPGLSLNTTFRTIIGQLVDSSRKRVYIELIIHPSENILYPSLVPFIKDIIEGLKVGVQRSSDKKAIAVQQSAPQIYGINFTGYFRLSKTTFDFSCQPTSKVFCSLNWQEGNFLVSSNSGNEGAQGLKCLGKIRGVSGNIRHAFSPEDCLKAETKDISFNATLMSRRTNKLSDDSISIIVDFPQITADLNIRHLQDLLLLKTIWVDQATKLYEVTVQNETIRTILQDNDTKEESNLTENELESSIAKAKPYSVYVILRLKNLDLSSDLGQAIGKVRFNTQNIRVRTKKVPGAVRSVSLSTDLLEIQSEGRLVGFATMTGLSFSTWLGAPPTSLSMNRTCLTNLLFKTERILSSLDYEYQKILVLEVDPMELNIKDQWINVPSEKSEVLVHTDLVLRHIEALVAVKTIPIFLLMSDKLLALIEEKRLFASNVISESTTVHPVNPIVASTLSGSPEHRSPKSGNENVNGSTFKPLQIGDIVVNPVGKITLVMELVRLTIFPHHFYDPDCVQTRCEKLIIDMRRSVDIERKIHLELSMNLNGINLSKSLCKKLGHKDEKKLSAQQWFDHVHASSSKNIFSLPSTHLSMITSQGKETNRVDYKFTTNFEGKVDVALNFSLIRYLQELVVLYKEQLKKNSIGTGEYSKTSVSSASPQTFTSAQQGLTQSKNISGDQSWIPHKSPPFEETNITQVTTKKRSFEYDPVEPVKLEPQLRIMGDATPPLEWVGVQRAKIPGVLHTLVMMNLDEILSAVYDIYAKELKDLRTQISTV